MECPDCGNQIYGAPSDGGDSGLEPIMIRYRCLRCGYEGEPEAPDEPDDTDFAHHPRDPMFGGFYEG